MTRDKLVKEGILRLKKFTHLMPQVIEEFEKDGVVNVSTTAPVPGILFWANEEQQQLIAKVEKQYNGVVYHGIVSDTTMGRMLNLLWVSNYASEWDMERDDIDDGIVFCYVYNLDVDWCSEFGSISVREINGGLQRVF